MKIRYIHFIIFTGLVFVSASLSIRASADMPYEECSWKSKSYTQRLVEDTLLQSLEAKTTCEECSTENNRNSFTETTTNSLREALDFPIPTECFFAAATHKLSRIGSRKRFYYCESPESKTPEDTMKVTTKNGKSRKLYPRRPCFNEAYVSMIAKSFHYMAKCFGLNSQERQDIFALFNHESSFVLNKRSWTKARCIGQLTKDTVYTMNKYIYMSNDKLLSSYHHIYREALKTCPDLNIKARLPETLSEEENPSYSKLKKINKNLNVDCLTTQAPYACFFYSMYNIKANKTLLEEELDSVEENLPQNLEISQSVKDFFQLPIRLNEVLHVTEIQTTADGQTREVNSFFQNDYELIEALGKAQYKKENLQVKKTTLYTFDKKTKAALVYWSYNGGTSIIRKYLQEFLIKKKKQIVEGDSSSSHGKKQIKKGQPLDFDFSISEDLQAALQKFKDIDTSKWTIKDLEERKPSDYQQLIKEEKEKIKQFKKDIENFTTALRQETLGKGQPPERFTDYLWLKYNGGDRRRAEVVEFVSKVKRDAEKLSDIQTNLKRMHRNSKNKPSKNTQKEFLESLKTKCRLTL